MECRGRTGIRFPVERTIRCCGAETASQSQRSTPCWVCLSPDDPSAEQRSRGPKYGRRTVQIASATTTRRVVAILNVEVAADFAESFACTDAHITDVAIGINHLGEADPRAPRNWCERSVEPAVFDAFDEGKREHRAA